MRKIATHMTHDINTAKKSYHHLKTKEAAVGSYVMMSQMAGETASDPEAGGSTEPERQPDPQADSQPDPESEAEEPPKKKRRKQYTQAQADVITNFFQLNPTSKVPSLSQCQEFLKDRGEEHG